MSVSAKVSQSLCTNVLLASMFFYTPEKIISLFQSKGEIPDANISCRILLMHGHLTMKFGTNRSEKRLWNCFQQAIGVAGKIKKTYLDLFCNCN